MPSSWRIKPSHGHTCSTSSHLPTSMPYITSILPLDPKASSHNNSTRTTSRPQSILPLDLKSHNIQQQLAVCSHPLSALYAEGATGRGLSSDNTQRGLQAGRSGHTSAGQQSRRQQSQQAFRGNYQQSMHLQQSTACICSTAQHSTACIHSTAGIYSTAQLSTACIHSTACIWKALTCLMRNCLVS